MISKYKKNEPLAFLHIPKCGGTSLRKIFEEWYGNRFYNHYFNERLNRLPLVRNLNEGSCIYGHFNITRGFGVEDYYPQINQYITVVRDPYEVVLSRFFHRAKRLNEGMLYRNGRKVVDELNANAWVKTQTSNYDIHMFKGLNLENYKTYLDSKFIYVGILEDFQNSVDIMANILEKPTIKVSKENISPREVEIILTREQHKEIDPLSYKIYEYALKRHNQTKKSVINV